METYPALTSASTPASSQFIRLTDIIIPPDRQRKDFNAQFLSELGETIRKRGLMHAVVLRESDGVFYLVAGESRMRAVSDLWMLGDSFNYNKLPVPENFIPYVTLGQLTPLQAEEAELDENLQRRDLSWMERSAAMAKLHRIRSAQAQAEGRIHTIADTAMETTGKTGGSYQENVRKEIVLAKHLDNPAIAKAATVDEAYKILKKQEETVKNLQLAAVVGKTFTEDLHQLFHVDCLDWMRDTQLLFDVILTDPPYGMGADTFGDAAGSLSNHVHQYDDSKANWIALMSAWCPLAFQVTKPQAHVYVFCDIDNFPQLRELMKLAGFYVFRTPLIHYKPNSGRVPLPTEGPRRQYETILYAIKGHKHTTAIYPDVISTFADSGLQHGAQKPVALFEDLLRRSVRPGDMVLDCFAGTGTVFPAANSLKAVAVGLEQNAEYYAIALKRLQGIGKTVVSEGVNLGDELQQMLEKKGVK